MKETKRLSKSGRHNPYYLAAFGSASADERCGRSCSHAARVLIKARQKLYNQLLQTEKGLNTLQDLVRHSPNYSDKLEVYSKRNSESSDDEDEGCHPRKPLFPLASLKETTAERGREPKVSGISMRRDLDTFGNEESYSMYSGNRRKAPGKGLFNSPSKPVQKRRRVKVDVGKRQDSIFGYDRDEEEDEIDAPKAGHEDFDYYEHDVEYILADSNDDDLDKGITHKVGGRVYSNSYQAPSDDEDDEDDMFSDTWSNKATVSDPDYKASNIPMNDDLEGIEYESDENDYNTGN